MLDVNQVRKDFPILEREAYPGKPLVYLDSAASSQKPLAVIEAMNEYYRQTNANVHRGIHRLSEDATNAYEGARERIAQFINAPDSSQVIYVRNATEGFNLVAYSWGRANIQAGDEMLLTEMEHHAN
ncbi:MAG: aminotransferase class V-fold PLP-dependent enzyme, partial [Chloroflexi bacterium]